MVIKPIIKTYTDPPGMPEDERMDPAELRTVREALGFTGEWLAQRLGVSSRTVRHWEQGKFPIPDGVRIEVERLEAVTGQVIGDIVAQLMDLPDPGVYVYRTDADYHAAHPEMSDWPAAWHRAVIYRVCLEVPALTITYAPPAGE